MSRRWLQFSLRGFLLATSALAVWLGFVAEKAERRKEAVAWLEEWGATLNYAHKWQGPSKPPLANVSPPGWTWLRRLLGPHYFDTVVNVELVAGNRQFTAAQTASARQGHVPRASRLLLLTDADFTALGHLPDLKRLRIIADLDVSAAGLKDLGRLTRLEMLTLDNTSGKSKGGVTDETLGIIDRLRHLTSLNLEGHPITDAGLAHVRWPAGLVDLNLSGTKISDAGLASLKQITSLNRLVVMDCGVTAAGISDFKRATPHCEVVFGKFDALDR